jgi:hydrocephalus-inducing protein
MGQIPPGSAALINVTFKAKDSKFYESTLAIDVANRDPSDQPEGIPLELSAESSIPGINTEDLD